MHAPYNKVNSGATFLQFKFDFMEKVLKIEHMKSRQPTTGLPTTGAYFLRFTPPTN